MGVACPGLARETVRVSYGQSGRPTQPKQPFSVLVSLKGKSTLSGFNFRVAYNASQVELTSVSDNTSQPAARVLYDLGPESPCPEGANVTDTYRNVFMSTSTNLTNASQLGELRFTTKPGFTGNVSIELKDAKPGDGLYNGNYENIDHDFARLEK